MGTDTFPGLLTAREYLDACGVPYQWHARLAWGALGAWGLIWTVRTLSGKLSELVRPGFTFDCHFLIGASNSRKTT